MDLLKRFWHNWKKFGQFLGDWLARIVLTVFYFTIFLPFGIGVRLLMDPLKIKPGHPLTWQERKTQDLKLEHGRRLH
ncbi:MAG: hypothetical protein Fur0022_05210 [Anaerolineales bacterium]